MPVLMSMIWDFEFCEAWLSLPSSLVLAMPGRGSRAPPSRFIERAILVSFVSRVMVAERA